MADVIFLHDGNRIDYTPSSDVAAGEVVVLGGASGLVGIATRPIPAGQKGSLAISGVFLFPKATGTGTAYPAGRIATYSLTNKRVQPFSGTEVSIGRSVEDASETDTTVKVVLRDGL